MAIAMNLLRLQTALPALAALLVGACSTPGAFPSLARRAQEDVPGRITGTLPPPPAAAPATPATSEPVPADDAAAAARLGSEAAAAHDRFTAARDRVESLTRAAAGAAPGSEAWTQATLALTELTAAHDATLPALSGLDGLYADQRVNGGDGGAIAAVRDQVTAWVADETAVLAELQGRVGG